MEVKKGTIILIHGYNSSPETWANTHLFFEYEGFEVIKPALRLPIKTVNPDPFLGADDVLAFLKSYDDLSTPLFLVGHSMGGLVAKAFLLRYGEVWNIKAVVTVATPHLGTHYASDLKPDFPQIGPIYHFSSDSPILEELNKAFDLPIPFLLVGAKAEGIHGDKVVGLWSQLPSKIINKPNVQFLLLKGTDHFRIHREPETLLKITQFIEQHL